MKKPYMVVLGDGFPRAEVLDQMNRDNRFGYWFYSMPNNFIIYSSVDANAIDFFIKEKTGGKYRYFISEISLSNCQGWMPKGNWDILNNDGVDKVYELMFNGYFPDKSDFFHGSGIYCVYSGELDSSKNEVRIKELLYIGGDIDIHQRLLNHESRQTWLGHLRGDDKLWYSYAPLDSNELERCKAALVILCQPKFPPAEFDKFGFLDTRVKIAGTAREFLKDGFVERNV